MVKCKVRNFFLMVILPMGRGRVCLRSVVVASVPFRWSFGEGSIVREHAPDDEGQAARHDYEGSVVFVPFLAESAEVASISP